ncbi:family 10 glycosylhydrolase [Deinococcus cellulosilyticus]|uniref:family 10 glycosylhydrolase n=1 Tax=Deinococcus cellulosilyticus TaxID=401558 RepID=UPI0011BFE040|nr:family 10 glycosylhydrolase [Deinococcus cellulosilyticus]
MKNHKVRISLIPLGLLLLTAPAFAQDATPGAGIDPSQIVLEIETLDPPVERQRIGFVNEAVMEDFAHNTSNYLALFSRVFGDSVTIPRFAVGAQVNAAGQVTGVVNPSSEGQVPVWEKEPTPLPIPDGGYVVLAFDTSYQKHNFKKFVATRMKPGARVHLLADQQEVTVQRVAGNTVRPILQLKGAQVFSTTDQEVVLGGRIYPYLPDQPMPITFQGQPVEVQGDGSFTVQASLKPGLNELGFTLLRAGQKIERSQLIRQVKPAPQVSQPVFMWMEQYTSMRLRSREDIYQYLVKAKNSGITHIALDVKGYEGFVSYLKNDLTGRPHVSSMVSAARQGANPNLDLLAEFVRGAHLLGLKLYAAINTFGEGSMQESALIQQHPTWEEQVYRPEDGGQILPVRQSKGPGRVVLFVNPVHHQVRDMQLKTIEEILKNYDVDGLILDRTRFDGGFADFSTYTREAFDGHLKPLGKAVSRWPDDVYRWVQQPDGSFARQEGPLYNDWWTFRAGVIGSFVKEVRTVVDRYKAKGRDLQLGQYVGPSYDNLYEVGINWASPEFQYDPRLSLVNGRIYTPEYSQTGYLPALDFVMLGTYQNDPFSVLQDLTIAGIVSKDHKPLLGGVGLENLSDPDLLRELLQLHRTYSSGILLFEYSTANLDTIRAGLADQQYTRQSWISVSTPSGVPLTLDGVNVPRGTGQLVLYTQAYGASTSTTKFGVEVTVDAQGRVVSGKNLQQARDWNFASPQDNDSLIPRGGFVLSALDASGSRSKRQGLAKAFQVGDPVRAVRMQLEGVKHRSTVDARHVVLQGEVERLGPGENMELRINGQQAVLRNGKFVQRVMLADGLNLIQVQVRVDGQVTLEQTLEVTRLKK